MSELEALLRGVVDRDQYTSRASVAALISLGIPALGRLLAELETWDSELKWAVTQLLLHLERSDARSSANELRLALLASRDESVVRDALSELGPPWDPRAWDSLVRLLAGRPSDSILAFTLHALARQRDPRAVGVIAAHLHDPEPIRRANAAQSLGLLGDPRGRTPLRALVHDAAHAWVEDRGPSLTVGEVARQALRQLGDPARGAAPGPIGKPMLFLAWSQIVLGVVGLAIGLVLCIGLALSPDQGSHAAAVIVPVFLMLASFVFGPACCAGFALLGRKPWARTLATVAATIELLVFPIGTVFGAAALWILFRSSSQPGFRVATAAVVQGHRPRAEGRVRGLLMAMLAVAAGFVALIGGGFWITGSPLPPELRGLVVPTLVLLGLALAGGIVSRPKATA